MNRSSRLWATLAALVWAAVVLGALALMFRGLVAGVYFEPTGEAIAEARHGRVLVAVACGLLVLAALYAVGAAWPLWVRVGLLVPVVLCGGLSWLAAGTLFPQLAVVVACPAALASTVGGLVAATRSVPRKRPWADM